MPSKKKRKKLALQQVTVNFSGTVLRYEELEGIRYLVAPMVMLTEGVHAGSGGPLYYPEKELEKTPMLWDHKPIVVYHPTMNGQPISACDPTVLNKQKVGIIMNTTYDSPKLRAEAWLNEERCTEVDERILEGILDNKMMEVSTGVFTDNEKKKGEWEEKEYTAIARNYRADHLALLPDQIGACSIDDGGGLLQINELSHDDLRTVLTKAVQTKIGGDFHLWIADVFQSYFVFEQDGAYYRMDYELEGDSLDTIVVKGDPLEVVRKTVYETIGGTFLTGNSQSLLFSNEFARGINVKKSKLVDAIIANENNGWDKDDRSALLELEPDKLKKMMPVANEEEDEEDEELDDDEDEELDEDEDEEPKTNKRKTRRKKVADAARKGASDLKNNKGKTSRKKKSSVRSEADEFITNAPDGVREMLQAGMNSFRAERQRLVSTITANEESGFTEKELATMNNDQLKKLAALASAANAVEEPNDNDDGFNYFGANGGFEPPYNSTNSDNVKTGEGLGLPVINWDE